MTGLCFYLLLRERQKRPNGAMLRISMFGKKTEVKVRLIIVICVTKKKKGKFQERIDVYILLREDSGLFFLVKMLPRARSSYQLLVSSPVMKQVYIQKCCYSLIEQDYR